MNKPELIVFTSLLALNGCDNECHGEDCNDELCQRWDWDMPEMEWKDGDRSQCKAGNLSEDDILEIMGIVNDLRSYAGLQELIRDSSNDQALQECALMQDIHVELSHEPTPDWDCYTDEGRRMSGQSSISLGTDGVGAIFNFMIDSNNEGVNGGQTDNNDTLGHRLDLLNMEGQVFGVGSTDNATCMWIGTGSEPIPYKEFATWPPNGEVPYAALQGYDGDIDSTGWSVDLADDFAFLNPEITVSKNGKNLDIKFKKLSWTGDFIRSLSITPQGWDMVAGESYEVNVNSDVETNAYLHSGPINYTTKALECKASFFQPKPLVNPFKKL